MTFFKINFLIKLFQEHFQNVKRFGYGSGHYVGPDLGQGLFQLFWEKAPGLNWEMGIFLEVLDSKKLEMCPWDTDAPAIAKFT